MWISSQDLLRLEGNKWDLSRQQFQGCGEAVVTTKTLFDRFIEKIMQFSVGGNGVFCFPLCSPHRFWFSSCVAEKSCPKILWEMPLNLSNPKAQRCCWGWFQDLPQQVPQLLLPARQKGLEELMQDWQGKYLNIPENIRISQKISDGQSTILCSPEELVMSATACSKEKSGENGNSSPFGLVFNSRTELMEAHAPRKLLWGLVFISSCFPRPPICPSCKAHMTGWLS